jgi:DNA (cytosine-5)-methyltransferase 1
MHDRCGDVGLFTIHLFSGIGGGILGDLLLGHVPICAVEIEPYPRRVLLQRQLDGILPVFPIWDNIETFRHDNPETAEFFQRASAVRSRLCIAGGFPCQDISSAGKGKGITGPKSRLWKEMARIIGEIRPAFAFIENSPNLVVRGLDRVLCDLAEMGYDAEWAVVSARDAIWNQACPSVDHERKRTWIRAHYADPELRRVSKRR